MTDSNFVKPLKLRRLDYYLLFIIVTFSSIVTMIITGLQLGFEYKKNISSLESRFHQIEFSYLDSLRSSLWNVDQPQVQLILEGILKLPDIAYVEIDTKEHGVYAKAGEIEESQKMGRSFPINYIHNGKNVYIGSLIVEASLNDVYNRLIQLCLVILLTNGVKTFIVSTFILLIIRRKVTRHLEKIARYFDEMVPENLHSKLILDKKEDTNQYSDEIDFLVNCINTMRSTIREKIDIIENNSKELSEKVHLQTFKLRESFQEKTNMLRILSHDINNPLTIILGHINVSETLLNKNKPITEKQILKIKRASNTIKEMVDQVRNLDAIQSGKITFQLESVNLFEMFEQAEFIFDEKLKKKNLTIEYDKEQFKTISVLAEPNSFSNQVVNNLISNAIKFSIKGEQIEAKVEEIEESIKISITDHGIGIPKDLQKILFDYEKSTSREGTSGEKGTGFGMILIKSCVEKYGGVIEIESRPMTEDKTNHGTTINIYLKPMSTKKIAA